MYTAIIDKFINMAQGESKRVFIGNYLTLRHAVDARRNFLKNEDKNSIFYMPSLEEAKRNIEERKNNEPSNKRI